MKKGLITTLAGLGIIIAALTGYKEQYKLVSPDDVSASKTQIDIPVSYLKNSITDQDVSDIQDAVLKMPPEVLSRMYDEEFSIFVLPESEIPDKDSTHTYRNTCDLTDHKVYIKVLDGTDYEKATVNALSFYADYVYGDASKDDDFKELFDKYKEWEDTEAAFTDGMTAYLLDDDTFRHTHKDMYVYFSDLTDRSVDDADN